MKKVLLILALLNLSVVYSKPMDKTVGIGYSLDKIKLNFGVPDIETEDSEDSLTWIYNEQFPNNNLVKSDTKVDKSVFVVKFDKNNSVKSYSYQFIMNTEK